MPARPAPMTSTSVDSGCMDLSSGRAEVVQRAVARSRAAAHRLASRGGEIQHAFDGPARGQRWPDPARFRLGEVRACSTPSSAFIAIQGHSAQLLQVAPWPAVGAARKVLPGWRCRMSWRMPWSVATMKVSASSRPAAAISCVVEPTTSACAATPAGDSGWTRMAACGCSRDSAANSSALNSSCTTQEPCHSSMSAPVRAWM